jgi:hypothetical protein
VLPIQEWLRICAFRLQSKRLPNLVWFQLSGGSHIKDLDLENGERLRISGRVMDEESNQFRECRGWAF